MAPHTKDRRIENDELTETEDQLEKLVAPQASPRKLQIMYIPLIFHILGHLAALYGLYLCLTSAKWKTILFNYILYTLGTIGITAGAHRLWTHKSYKAKMPLQIILIVLNSLAFQHSAYNWIRDHKLHHRYSDTDADPHNATRGFFFSHIGWLFVKKHPEVRRRGKFIDMSDIKGNPVIMFQKKYAIPFIGSICFLLPTIIPMYFWGETLNNAWYITILRHFVTLNVIFMVNSVTHMFGTKPYDKNINPTQNRFVSVAALGEGFHNYHHVYPWDYRTAELGNNWLNLTTKFIDFFAWIGWAYDLKTVPEEVVRARAERTGDGTYEWRPEQKVGHDD